MEDFIKGNFIQGVIHDLSICNFGYLDIHGEVTFQTRTFSFDYSV